MFTITKVDNRVDISSTGIDFRITGAYISGTSYMVANIEAVGYDWEVTSPGTGTFWADVRLVSGNLVSIRGCQWGRWGGGSTNIWQNLDSGTSFSATSITGSASLVFSKVHDIGGTSITPLAKNGNYLYFAHGNGGTAYIDEVNTYTGVTGSIMYETGGSTYIGNNGVSLAWLEGRKVVMTDVSHAYAGTESQVWLLDFDTGTITKILEVPFSTAEGNEQWVYQLTALKSSNGTIHIICMGEMQVYYPDYGYRTCIWDCNYSSGLSFDYYDVQADPSPYDIAWTGVQDNYDLVKSRYVVVYGRVQYNSGGFKLANCVTACVYDIYSPSLSYNTIQYGNWEFPCYEMFHSVDQTNGKTYFYATGWEDSDPYYTRLIEFDPITGVSSVVWSIEIVSYGFILMFESKTNSYFYDPEEGKLYLSYNQQLIGTFTLPFSSFSNEKICGVIDEGTGLANKCIWYLDGSHLKAVLITGSVVVDKDLTGSITLLNHHSVIHLIDKMMIATYKDSAPYTMNYYLVT